MQYCWLPHLLSWCILKFSQLSSFSLNTNPLCYNFLIGIDTGEGWNDKWCTCSTLFKLEGTCDSGHNFTSCLHLVYTGKFEKSVGISCHLIKRNPFVLFLLGQNSETFLPCPCSLFPPFYIVRFWSWHAIWKWCWRTSPFSRFFYLLFVFGGWFIIWFNINPICYTTNWPCLMRATISSGFCSCIH